MNLRITKKQIKVIRHVCSIFAGVLIQESGQDNLYVKNEVLDSFGMSHADVNEMINFCHYIDKQLKTNGHGKN